MGHLSKNIVSSEYSYVYNLSFKSKSIFRMKGISSFRCFCSFVKISLLVFTIFMFSVIYNFNGTSQKTISRKKDDNNNKVTVTTVITTVNDSNTINKTQQDSRKSNGILISFSIILIHLFNAIFNLIEHYLSSNVEFFA